MLWFLCYRRPSAERRSRVTSEMNVSDTCNYDIVGLLERGSELNYRQGVFMSGVGCTIMLGNGKVFFMLRLCTKFTSTAGTLKIA